MKDTDTYLLRGTKQMAQSNDKALEKLVTKAWQAYDHESAMPLRIEKTMPILFFGDIDAYKRSKIRIITVGLNPSTKEFPEHNRFRRFPAVKHDTAREANLYLAALSNYFKECPYDDWFEHYEGLLKGMGASYYGETEITALQTELCSPVVTDPTWGDLRAGDRKALSQSGSEIWHELVNVLEPSIAILSMGFGHLSQLKYKSWKNLADAELKSGIGGIASTARALCSYLFREDERPCLA